MNAPLPPDEKRRLKELRDFAILDTPPEPEFDDIVELAAEICGTPVALITLLDERRQWFKARHGLALTETSRSVAFCAHAILRHDELLEVPDTTRDERFADNPLVVTEDGFRFYAGAPLAPPGGPALGTLCVLDRQPRQLDEMQRRTLQILSRLVMAQLQLRRRNRDLHNLGVTQQRLARQLIDAQAVARIGSWETDLATMDVVWTEETHRIFGTDPTQFQPTHARFLEMVHPADREAVDAAFRESLDAVAPSFIVHRACRPDGEERVVEERWQVFRNDAGRPERAVGTSRDITKPRRLEEERLVAMAALQASEAGLKEAQRVARMGSWSLDLATGRVTWTEELARMMGLDPGQPPPEFPAQAEFFTPDSWQRLNAAVNRAARQGVPYEMELEICARDGASRWMLARGEPVRGPDGVIKRLIGMAQDITERHVMEQQLLRAQRMESIGTLAGGMAHDLNNLLAPITVGVDLLRKTELPADSREVIETIERAANRCASLVRQVLSFARGIEGERLPLQVRHLAREIESIIESTFPKNIIFEQELAPELWVIQGDPTQINQVLVNLCVNARDAMPDGGRLTLRAENLKVDEPYAAMHREARPGRYVALEIADTGCGISRDNLERIFDPFYTTKEVGKGTGLGLATVLGIVRSHGGFVSVKSTRGEGSQFRICLPAVVETTGEAPVPEAETSLPRGDGELVLLVDDEASILLITGRTLEEFGYRVLKASDGAEAIALFADHSTEVALVITDMMMPVMDGPALIAALRRINPEARIIGSSGLRSAAETSRKMGARPVVFLYKPYSAESLLKAVRKALTSPVPRGSA